MIAAAHPSVAAARATLTAPDSRVVHVRYDATVQRRGGYALFFTVVSTGARSAVLVKVCEDRSGRVTGSSDVSSGEPSC